MKRRTERERFEDWARTEYQHWNLATGAAGWYANSQTQAAWMAWKAAVESMKRRPANGKATPT